ncbi:uncharacterized protein BJX67DRAFT_384028 [Aspergillus lucknowensis]|uniref:BZIP domain-containing protein n=1 Tax=Aspergillus lucknowensis TaxID=176173 RepID=A0ABR4LJA1_9EURO
MPTKRGSGDIDLPDIAEDPAERKRLLNVLAQRRYRQRKKVRLQALQAQVEKQRRAAEAKESSNTDPQIDLAEFLQPSSQNEPEKASSPSFHLSEAQGFGQFDSTAHGLDALDALDASSVAIPDTASSSSAFLSLFSMPDASQAFSVPQIPASSDPFACLSPRALQIPSNGEQLTFWPNTNTNEPNNASSLSDQLQTYQSSTFTFPDDHIIEIPSLKLLNAAMKVALRLNVAHLLWDISAKSPFYKERNSNPLALSPPSLTYSSSSSSSSSPPSSSSSSSSTSTSTSPNASEPDIDIPSLPTHLQPTPTQRLLPHHPVLDILPWPSTRDKLIQTFNLPPELRPESAQHPTGMLRLVYDMEDEGGEGMRIRGDDIFEPGAWEIGQVVFQRWWWAFDSVLVERCDQARRRRGEGGLVLGALS